MYTSWNSNNIFCNKLNEKNNSNNIDEENIKLTERDNKVINISGTANRYQIKKMTVSKVSKIRVASNNWNICESDLTHECQLKIINDMNNAILHKYGSIFVKQIESKISSYKQQDILKKRLDVNKFITYKQVLSLLHDSKLICDYCSCKIFILYEIVRELKQWTLDRIDNDKGHNMENVVIACLDCNIRRRRKNKDDFMFSKNMEIVREGFIQETRNK